MHEVMGDGPPGGFVFIPIFVIIAGRLSAW